MWPQQKYSEKYLRQSFWLFSKTHSIIMFLTAPGYPRAREEQNAACVSLSLSTMSISNQTHIKAQKPAGHPSQASRLTKAILSVFDTKASSASTAPLPLSDPAYRRHNKTMSSNCAKNF
jgi:hypothetical protein